MKACKLELWVLSLIVPVYLLFFFVKIHAPSVQTPEGRHSQRRASIAGFAILLALGAHGRSWRLSYLRVASLASETKPGTLMRPLHLLRSLQERC